MAARGGMCAWGVVVVCAGLWAQAQPAAQGSTAEFIMSGTSTVRGWSCPARGAVTITAGTSGQAVPGFPSGISSATIRVPVKAIECEEPDMRVHLQEALNEPANPEIVYQLEQYTLSGSNAATTKGQLTVAGVTRPVDINVKLVSASGSTRVVGEISIDLTTFSVTPPTLWLGMLKVGKDVRVRFDVVLPSSSP